MFVTSKEVNVDMHSDNNKPGPPWWWWAGLAVKAASVLTWLADRFGQDA